MTEVNRAQAPTEVVDGFIILGPGFSAEMGVGTFGRTISEAWERHIGPRKQGEKSEDRAMIRHRWAQRGWRPVPAKLVVDFPQSCRATQEATNLLAKYNHEDA